MILGLELGLNCPLEWLPISLSPERLFSSLELVASGLRDGGMIMGPRYTPDISYPATLGGPLNIPSFSAVQCDELQIELHGEPILMITVWM